MNPASRWFIKALCYGAACTLILFLGFGVYVAMYIPYSNARTIERKAHRGDANAQRVLGFGYETGRFALHSFGVIPKDKAKALYWYTKSAESGNGEGAFNLARLYEIDNLGAKNKEALYWYRISAKRGSLHGASRMASIYSQGLLGESVNAEKAKYWSERVERAKL